jgi:hypothetical protein
VKANRNAHGKPEYQGEHYKGTSCFLVILNLGRASERGGRFAIIFCTKRGGNLSMLCRFCYIVLGSANSN